MKKLIKGYFDLGFVSVTLQMLISAKDFGLKTYGGLDLIFNPKTKDGDCTPQFNL